MTYHVLAIALLVVCLGCSSENQKEATSVLDAGTCDLMDIAHHSDESYILVPSSKPYARPSFLGFGGKVRTGSPCELLYKLDLLSRSVVDSCSIPEGFRYIAFEDEILLATGMGKVWRMDGLSPLSSASVNEIPIRDDLSWRDAAERTGQFSAIGAFVVVDAGNGACAVDTYPQIHLSDLSEPRDRTYLYVQETSLWRESEGIAEQVLGMRSAIKYVRLVSDSSLIVSCSHGDVALVKYPSFEQVWIIDLGNADENGFMFAGLDSQNKCFVIVRGRKIVLLDPVTGQITRELQSNKEFGQALAVNGELWGLTAHTCEIVDLQ